MSDAELRFAVMTLSDVGERAFGESPKNTFRNFNPDMLRGNSRISAVSNRAKRLLMYMMADLTDEEFVMAFMG